MSITTQYRVHYRARIYTYFNTICPVVVDYDHKSGWVEALDDIVKDHDDFVKFLNENGYYESILTNLVSVHDLSNRNYVSSHFVNNWVEASFYGFLLPIYIQPGKSYVDLQATQTDNLKTLQAVMMMYNATLLCGVQGNIILTSKGTYSSAVIDIADDDVVSFTVKRGNQEIPDTSKIEVLAGDTTELQRYVKAHLVEFFAAKWRAAITIDQIANYTINLQSKIRIRGVTYAVIEVLRNYEKDEYKVTAWQLN